MYESYEVFFYICFYHNQYDCKFIHVIEEQQNIENIGNVVFIEKYDFFLSESNWKSCFLHTNVIYLSVETKDFPIL